MPFAPATPHTSSATPFSASISPAVPGTLGILCALAVLGTLALPGTATAQSGPPASTSSPVAATCADLLDIDNLTLISADVRELDRRGAEGLDTGATRYCYVRGILPPAIGFHVQLPLPGDWNGRFLLWGDGGKDGDLDFADHRVAEGYAVANTNMGHDNGAEPGSSFGYRNRQSEIDFGYRAVHLTTVAAKEIVAEYYDGDPAYSYFEGCSTGGRQGLMEAQRYPFDFDGIIAGAPAHRYQGLNAGRTWMLQQTHLDGYAGSLSTDTDGDGLPDSNRPLEILAERVVEVCDEIDGIADGVIADPRACDFEPARHLAEWLCPAPGDGGSGAGRGAAMARPDCFTPRQIETIEAFYAGAHDPNGNPVYPGLSPGSEPYWSLYVPHAGNRYRAGALGITGDHLNYLFYEEDPGVAPPDLGDLTRAPDPTALPPEWAWWQFDITDVTRGEGDLMMSITDADDPDLTRFLVENDGKLISYHGWADGLIMAKGTVDYWEEMVDVTFGGDEAAARERARLFMLPGVGHCSGGPGPSEWDRLPYLVEWVENGNAPDALVVTRSEGGEVVDERPVFPYPDRAEYVGPLGGQNDPGNWVAENFAPR